MSNLEQQPAHLTPPTVVSPVAEAFLIQRAVNNLSNIAEEQHWPQEQQQVIDDTKQAATAIAAREYGLSITDELRPDAALRLAKQLKIIDTLPSSMQDEPADPNGPDFPEVSTQGEEILKMRVQEYELTAAAREQARHDRTTFTPAQTQVVVGALKVLSDTSHDPYAHLEVADVMASHHLFTWPNPRI